MTLLVAGALHLDVVLRAPHLPRLDETVAGQGVDYVFGGKGGNQALAAARMGADVHFAGRAGSDAFGDMIRQSLMDSGMDLSLLQRDDGASGMSAAIVDDAGEYGAVIVSAANQMIDAGLIAVPHGTTLVLLQNEIPEAVNLDVARRAKAAGAQVWLNAAPARAVSDAMLDAVDLFIVNRVEATFYEVLGHPGMLTTLGADGVSYRGKHYAARHVKVVSTHGAGDMFIGALAAKACEGVSLPDAIPFAQAAAGLHVASDQAARAGFGCRDVEAFLAQSNR